MDIYQKALKHDGKKSRMLSAGEEATEFAAAIFRYINRPDRPEALEQVQREFLQLKMCMRSVETVLEIEGYMQLEEITRFSDKLKQRMKCPCKRGGG